MKIKNIKGSVSIRTVSALLLVLAVVCVSSTLFVNESEGAQGNKFWIEGIQYEDIGGGKASVIGHSDKNNNDGPHDSELIIPSTVENGEGDLSVVSIGDNAFNGCTSLTSITLPNSVETIDVMAFTFCTSLTSVSMNSVTSIGTGAFNNCTSLTSVSMDSVTSIGKNAFFFCTSLTSVSMNSATSIDDNAFNGCTSLTSVYMNSVETIGMMAFAFCTSLTSVSIDSVKEIDGSAFTSCTSLTSVSMNSVETIGMLAFIGCTSLISISIPNSVTSIGDSVFAFCNALSTVTISGEGTGGVNILANYFSKEPWIMKGQDYGSGTGKITTLIIDTTNKIDIDKVKIIDGNTLRIAYGANNVIGADGKVIFDGKAVDGKDRACKTYTGKDGQWMGSQTPANLTLIPNDRSLGEVFGSGNYYVGDVVRIKASPIKGYMLKGWIDENGNTISTASNYSLTLTKEKIDLTAVFVESAILNVLADPITYGEVTGSGIYEKGSIVYITAKPNEGYKFVSWSDGNEEQNRSIKLTSNRSLTAYFAEEDPTMCKVTVIIEGNGMVYGMGTVEKGKVITLNAVPDNGHSFQGWSHTTHTGTTISLSVESNMVITATFSATDTGIGGSSGSLIDTTTAIVIILIIVIVFGSIVVISLVRGRRSV